MGESLNNSSNWQFIGSMKSRDHQRTYNVSSVADQAFEYYKNNNKWPEKISDLKYPVTAPTPVDGKCTEEGNKYTLITRGDSLLISFCLGKDSDEPNYNSSDMKSKNKAGMNVAVLKKPSSTSRYEQYIYNLSFEPYNCPPERKCLFDKDQPEANPFKDILRKNRPFDIQSFHGVSKVENEWTAHYTLKLDKNKLRNIFISVAKQSVGENDYNSDKNYEKERREDFERRLDWWLNNQNITNFDVWLGVNSGRLYRVSWDQDFSSLTSQLNWAYKSITSGALKQSYFHNEVYYENFTPDQKRLLDVETGCDGVMLGRAIFGNPWRFNSKEKKENKTVEEILTALVEHTKLFEKLLPQKSFAIMKKHFKAYINGWEGAKELRLELMEANSASEVEKTINKYLNK
jgi:hypothetical protein